jgi:hypothetical protein
MLESKTSPWMLELLSLLHQHPAPCANLSGGDLKTLSAFLMGYRAARVDLGAPAASEEEEALLRGFTAWLKRRFRDDRGVSWETIVEEQYQRIRSSRSGKHAQYLKGSAGLFFDLFEQYLDSVRLGYPRVDLHEPHAGEMFLPRRDRIPPPIPDLIDVESGTRERTWLCQFARQVPFDCAGLAAMVGSRARQLYRENLSRDNLEQWAEGIVLKVTLRRRLPRTLEVRVARRGTAPNWEVAADTWVMVALEEKCGRITKWQGVPREEWRLWPLPPGGIAG